MTMPLIAGVVAGGGSPAPPPTTFTDTFVAADGTSLPVYNANWTVNNGVYTILTNQLRPGGSLYHQAAHWNSFSFSADQFAETVLNILDNPGIYLGPAVRVQDVDNTCYMLTQNASDMYLQKRVLGNDNNTPDVTLVAGVGLAIALGHTLRLEVTGSPAVLKAFDNGVEIVAMRYTDAASPLASGSPGVASYSGGSDFSLIGTWTGGNL